MVVFAIVLAVARIRKRPTRTGLGLEFCAALAVLAIIGIVAFPSPTTSATRADERIALARSAPQSRHAATFGRRQPEGRPGTARPRERPNLSGYLRSRTAVVST